MTPAAMLQILVTANTAQASTALAKTQGQLTATSATATKTGAVMKKAFLGIGLAAAGAGVALFKVGEEFDEAYDKIRTRTGATGKEMVKLKRIFRDVVSDVPASFEDASTAVGDLNTRLGLTGRPLAKASKQMTELSRITKTDLSGNIESVSKAFVDWEVSTKDQTKTLDGFFRLSQKSGMAVSDIAESVQKFGSPLRQLGFSLDEAAAMFASFERAGVNTETMVPGLKLAISNLTRPTATLGESMRKLGIETGKPEVALRQVFKLMSGNTISSIEKTGLAMDVFGKRAGADMAEAIKQGRFELGDFLKVMRDGDGTIRETGRQTMDLGDHWLRFTNLLKLKVEPIAKKVFKGLGDLMKEVTRAYKDGGLEAALKVLGDKISNIVAEWAPKAAEAALKLGWAVAKGLVRGFLDAPILVKLAVGAWLMKALGGGRAVTALGAKLGGLMLGGLLGRTAAGGLMGKLSQPGMTPARPIFVSVVGGFRGPGGTPTPTGRGPRPTPAPRPTPVPPRMPPGAAGGRLALGAGALAIPFGISAVGGGLLGQLADKILGKSTGAISNAQMSISKLRVEVQNLAEAGKKVPANMIRKAGLDPQKLREAGVEVGGLRKHVDKLRDGWGKPVGKVLVNSVVDGSKVSRGEISKMLQSFNKLEPGLRQSTARAALAHVAELRKGGRLSKVEADKMRDAILDTLEQARRGGNQSTFDLAKGVAANIGALAGAVAGGMANVQKNTNNSLEAFGVKALKFAIETVGNLFGGAQRNQTGGVIVPGSGSGDKVRALLEPGEVVINKKAVAAMGGARRADRINHLIPRFATGGWVDPAGPGTGVVNPAIAGVVGAWSNRYNAAINYGYDPGGGHLSPGHNVTGTATDTGPAAGWGRAPTRLFETGLKAILGKVDQILYGSHGVGTAYPNHGWGNHAHIEWGMHPEVQGAVQAKIARQILKGPAGPLTSMGQSALDRVRGAAQKFVGRQVGMSGGADMGSFGSPGLYSLSELMKLWTTVNDGLGNPSTMARIALAESSGNPRAVGNDPGGTTGLGLWQITTGFNDDIIARFGGRNAMFIPSKNAAAAGAIFGRQGLGAWGASSANWQLGGIVQKLAGGGIGGNLPGGGPNNKPNINPRPGMMWKWSNAQQRWIQVQRTTDGGGGGGGGGAPAQAAVSWQSVHDPLAVLSSLFDARSTTEKLAEQIANAETFDAFFSSPAGQDLSPAERAGQVALNTQLLGWLTWQRDLAQLSSTLFPASAEAESWGGFLSEIADLQGSTGAGGRMLDVRRQLDSLTAPLEALDALEVIATTTEDDSDRIRADLLFQQLTEARRSNAILRQQMPIFKAFNTPYGGSFHNGGVVPGPIGQDRMIMAQGGEVVSKGGAQVVIYIDKDAGVDPSRIRAEVDGVLTEVVRAASPRGGVVGRKAAYQ